MQKSTCVCGPVHARFRPPNPTQNFPPCPSREKEEVWGTRGKAVPLPLGQPERRSVQRAVLWLSIALLSAARVEAVPGCSGVSGVVYFFLHLVMHFILLFVYSSRVKHRHTSSLSPLHSLPAQNGLPTANELHLWGSSNSSWCLGAILDYQTFITDNRMIAKVHWPL